MKIVWFSSALHQMIDLGTSSSSSRRKETHQSRIAESSCQESHLTYRQTRLHCSLGDMLLSNSCQLVQMKKMKQIHLIWSKICTGYTLLAKNQERLSWSVVVLLCYRSARCQCNSIVSSQSKFANKTSWNLRQLTKGTTINHQHLRSSSHHPVIHIEERISNKDLRRLLKDLCNPKKPFKEFSTGTFSDNRRYNRYTTHIYITMERTREVWPWPSWMAWPQRRRRDAEERLWEFYAL